MNRSRCSALRFTRFSKKDQEEMMLLFGRTYGLPVVALRYFNIYGTRQALSNPYTGVAAIFASRLLNGRAPLIFEDGRADAGLRQRARRGAAQMCWPWSGARRTAWRSTSAPGSPSRLNEIADVLGGALGIEMPAEITGKYRAGDIRHCFADISRGRRECWGTSQKSSSRRACANWSEWLGSQTAEDRAAEAVEQLQLWLDSIK